MAQQRAVVEGNNSGKKPAPRGLLQSSQPGGISGALKTIMAPGVALSKAQQSALMAYLKSLSDSASRVLPGGSGAGRLAGPKPTKPSKPQPKPVKPEPKTKPPMSRPKPKPKPKPAPRKLPITK